MLTMKIKFQQLFSQSRKEKLQFKHRKIFGLKEISVSEAHIGYKKYYLNSCFLFFVLFCFGNLLKGFYNFFLTLKKKRIKKTGFDGVSA